MGRVVERSQELLRRARGLGQVRLLHQRSAVPRGVLHARRDRQGRARDAAHGRQHAPLHRHRGGGAEGELRHGRPAGLLFRRRPLRRDRPLRAQRRRDADRALDAHARPSARDRSAEDARRRSTADARRRAKPTSTSPSATARTVALLNGLLRELIAARLVRRGLRGCRTPSASRSSSASSRATTPARGRAICDIPAASHQRRPPSCSARRSACSRPCLQGVYQSNQATAAACQVNNLHLLRGMIGRPGAGILPDERSADGAEHPRDRRRRRPAGLPQLGQQGAHPRSSPSSGTSTRSPSRTGRRRPTRCRSSATRSRGRSSCSGSRRPTRPSRCPELARVRRILERDGALVVVQDIFLTETAAARRRRAAGRRPGARRLGTFTNVDRTVHLSERAVDPPGEARADLDIFLDYARRMDFRDRDGAAAHQVAATPESAFEAWKACSARPAVRLHRPDLREAARRQRHPMAVHRCSAGGHRAALHRRALQHRRRLLRDVRPRPRDRRADRRGGIPRQGARRTRVPACRASTSRSPEVPDDELPAAPDHGPHAVPLPHAHQDGPGTRARTPPRLTSGSRSAPPTPTQLGVGEGDVVSRRVAPRLAAGAGPDLATSGAGVIFVPFHYGDWDSDASEARDELPTSSPGRAGIPVSKQPQFKVAAVRVRELRAGDGRPAPAPVPRRIAPAQGRS